MDENTRPKGVQSLAQGSENQSCHSRRALTPSPWKILTLILCPLIQPWCLSGNSVPRCSCKTCNCPPNHLLSGFGLSWCNDTFPCLIGKRGGLMRISECFEPVEEKLGLMGFYMGKELFFLLKYSWFTVLCQSLLYSKVTQLYAYRCFYRQESLFKKFIAALLSSNLHAIQFTYICTIQWFLEYS